MTHERAMKSDLVRAVAYMVLTLLSLVAWCRSYFTVRSINWTITSKVNLLCGWHTGSLHFRVGIHDRLPMNPGVSTAGRYLTHGESWERWLAGDKYNFRFLGWGADHNRSDIRLPVSGQLKDRVQTLGLAVPFWFIGGLCGWGAAVALRKWTVCRQRSASRKCGSCGYDLRASIDRCPECGASIRAPSPSAGPSDNHETQNPRS
jgi:rRNA maturation protein Nop10